MSDSECDQEVQGSKSTFFSSLVVARCSCPSGMHVICGHWRDAFTMGTSWKGKKIIYATWTWEVPLQGGDFNPPEPIEEWSRGSSRFKARWCKCSSAMSPDFNAWEQYALGQGSHNEDWVAIDEGGGDDPWTTYGPEAESPRGIVGYGGDEP